MNFGVAFGKPFSNVKNLLIGLVLTLIPLVNILTIPGYFLRLANHTMNKNNALPGFENFSELVVNSLKVLVLAIVYMLLSTVVTIVLALIPLLGPLLIVVWNIVFIFLVLSAVMTLAKTGNLRAAFGLKAVAKKALAVNFIIAVVVGMVISGLVLGILFVLLGVVLGASFLPALMSGTFDAAMLSTMFSTMILGGIVVGIVGYILNVFFYSLAAEAYQP